MGIQDAVESLISVTHNKGGDTRSISGQKVPESGYMVGGVVDSLFFDAHLISNLNHFPTLAARIAEWVNDNLEVATSENVFLGSWIDMQENIAYIDLSVWHSDEKEALRNAKILGELAIWDLDNEAEIRVS